MASDEPPTLKVHVVVLPAPLKEVVVVSDELGRHSRFPEEFRQGVVPGL